MRTGRSFWQACGEGANECYRIREPEAVMACCCGRNTTVDGSDWLAAGVLLR